MRLNRRVRIGWREATTLVVLALFVVWSVYTLFDDRRPPAAVSLTLDTAITTLAAVVSGAVAFLEWGRFRLDGQSAALYRAGAFLVLCLANVLSLAMIVSGLDIVVGMTVDDPGQWPLWVGVLTQAVASILFVLGGITALRRAPTQSQAPAVLFLTPALLVAMLMLLAGFAPASLPTLLDESGIRSIMVDPRQPPPGVTAAFTAGHLGPGGAYLFAAALSYLVFRRDRAPAEAILAAGLLLAALAQVHSAVHPGAYASIVTSGDLLRMLFSIGLLIGLVVENRVSGVALRRANIELRRLHDLELAEATLHERARLAREIHDGLAQDLWFAKLKQSRLVQVHAGNPEAQTLASEVVHALDAALAEARQAVMALRPAAGGSLLEVLSRYVDDFGDRFGIRAEFIAEGRLPEIDARAQAEVLRVVQEALNNVRKHADATVVKVEVRGDGDHPVVRVTDNGRGFEPAAVGRGYGLHSMEERVELIGGDFIIHSAPHDGTTVEVRLPSASVA